MEDAGATRRRRARAEYAPSASGADDGVRAPRRVKRSAGISLQAQAVLAALGLAALSTGACALLMAHITERQLETEMRTHVERSADRTRDALAPLLKRNDRASIAAAITTSMADARHAFISLIVSESGSEITRVREQSIWAAHQSREVLDPNDARLRALDSPIAIQSEDRRLGYAWRTVLRADDGLGTPLGFLTIGVSDPTYLVIRGRLHRTALAATAMAGLVMAPLALLGARRMTGPLEEVVDAIEHMAEGRRPERLGAEGPREIATLAHSFNRMVDRLGAAHEALRGANRRLESQVERRTEELRRVNELLRLEIREKSDFLRTVSHDLGAPLRNIAGMTSLIMSKYEGEMPAEALQRLERISANVQIEEEMLEDLLNLSRLGLHTDEPQNVDTGAMVRNLAAAFEHELGSGGIAFRIEGDFPMVRLAPGRLRNVFQNLIDNAIKYMGDSQEREIRVSCRLTDDEAVFAVSDTGPGIPEPDHERIFQVFRRGATATEGVPGKGVGLAAVQSVVMRWSGKMSLESEPGRGSVFRFTVPAERVMAASESAGELEAGAAGK